MKQWYVQKRDGSKELFNFSKIEAALNKAFRSTRGTDCKQDVLTYVKFKTNGLHLIEDIQDAVEESLMIMRYYDVAKAYIKYRESRNNSRFIKERIDYMNKYTSSTDNASSSSETDSNANVNVKNVANLEGEVYKSMNRTIQRQRMKTKLHEMFPEVAKQYESDLNHHIIYTNDEASTPVLKYYCCAVTLYPLMTEGAGNIDGVTPSAPNDIQSFSGQVTNLAFLLSSQCKGAVAFGDYFVALNYYVVKEFGEDWYNHLDKVVTTAPLAPKTIQHFIEKGMKTFIYGVNQPAGNRSFNSPFTNVSYYDKNYFKAMFDEFYYPDGTKPEWTAIDKLQRIFMALHRRLRLIKPLTFPVSTIALVHNNKEFLDNDYKELCAEEWAKGGSFFCYNNDNPASLASCCRVLNEMTENTFSSTTGMSGVKKSWPLCA